MIFTHNDLGSGANTGEFYIPSKVNALCHPVLNKKVIKEFWKGHTYRLTTLSTTNDDALIFKVGDVEIPSLEENNYAINVMESGIAVVGKDEQCLIQGFMTLIDMIKLKDDGQAYISTCFVREKLPMQALMAHFCIFPETKLWELEKYIRFCGALKYTHLIIEFWGTLKFDCLKELGWKNAYSKKEIKKLVKLANDLGMQVIPMFNHWGHATSSRVCHGKHVVLDQNPTLSHLFSEDGWCWRYKSQKVKDLLKNIRKELIELCGDGEYFHVGCDEAYGFDYSEQSMIELCSYLNEISAELNSANRKMIMWGDMCLYKNPDFNDKNWYSVSAHTKEQQDFMLSQLDKNIILADWQYYCKTAPVETSLVFKKAGFNVLLCPSDNGALAVNSCVDTVKTEKMYGVMQTTWHTLALGTPNVGKTACDCWNEQLKGDTDDFGFYRSHSAGVMRKTNFARGKYKKTGWSKVQVRDFV